MRAARQAITKEINAQGTFFFGPHIPDGFARSVENPPVAAFFPERSVLSKISMHGFPSLRHQVVVDHSYFESTISRKTRLYIPLSYAHSSFDAILVTVHNTKRDASIYANKIAVMEKR